MTSQRPRSLEDCSLYQRLQEIYSEYGYVLDCNVSVPFKGLNAMKDMNAVVVPCVCAAEVAATFFKAEDV